MRRRIAWASASLFLLGVPALGHAQQARDVTGRVTVQGTGQPIPDATVGLVGMPVGARTNEKGEYHLRISTPGEVTVMTRMLGYKRQSVRLPASQSVLNFELERDVLQLEGVTVTGAATTMDKRNAASAVTSVAGEELSRVPARSIEAALQGKVVGASITMNNGAPGGGGQIQIRGASSLIGRIDPLYVVDGVIISNDVRSNSQSYITGSLNKGEENGTNRLADINPNDIENIEVLKGSVASAIYGSQATNGVVVITTKRGRSGAPRFDLTQRVGQYSLVRNKGMRHYQNLQEVLDASPVSGNQAGEDAAAAVCTATSCPYYDYIGELYGRRDPSLETMLSMSGGVETTKYYVSADDRQEAGIANNTGARHQSARASVDQAIGSKLTVNVGANLMRSFSQRGISNNDNALSSPLYGFAYTPAVLDLRQRDASGNYAVNPFGGGPTHISNPFQTFDLMTNNEDVYRMIGNVNASYAAWSNSANTVRLNFLAGFDRSSTENYLFAPTTLQIEQPGTSNGNYPGQSIQGNGDALLRNSQVSATWQLRPGNGWLNATTSTGVQLEARQYNDYTIIAEGIVPTVTSPIGAVNTVTSVPGRSEVRNQAFFVSEDFLTLNERLLLSGALRGEKSSVNGDPGKVYTFPRVAASYRFVNPLRFVDEFKLRATQGQAGNQASYGDRFLTLSNGGQIDGQTGLIQASTIGNPDIRPERLTETEYGFDGSFLGDRAHVEATWYTRDIHDLLVRPLLAPSTGVNQEVINGGKMRTRGSEFGLTVAPIESRTGGLSWTSRATYQTTKAKILSFAPGVRPFTIGAAGGFGTAYGRLKFSPGQSVSAIYGNYDRPDGTVARDTVLGDATPKFQMAFSNDFTWGNFSLGSVVDWRKGGTVANMTLNLFDEGNNTWDYDNPSPDTNVGTTLGAYRYNLWDGGNNTNVYLQDGSFVKVREVTLSYDVPQRYLTRLQSAGVRSTRVSVSGRNLFIFSKYNGFDPEVNNGGNVVARFVDLAPFPPSRSIFFSLDLGF